MRQALNLNWYFSLYFGCRYSKVSKAIVSSGSLFIQGLIPGILEYNYELQRQVEPDHREQEVFPFLGIVFYE